MVTDNQIAALCNQLQHAGSAVMDDGQGSKLAFISSHVLAMPDDTPSVLVAWEGKGAFFWRVGNQISPFDLINSGFSLRVAPQLASILQRVGAHLSDRGSSHVKGAMPMLEARKGMLEGDE